MKVYFPMTMDIVHPGHINCLRWLKKKGTVCIGLLTDKALKGYKEPVMPFKDRMVIAKIIAWAMGCKLVPQNSLNPSANIKKYNITAIASGDGWEKVELKAIEQFGLKKIDILLPKKYGSELIKKKIRRIKV